MRAGGTMEAGFKRVFSDAVIGKLLIQTNPNTGDPEVIKQERGSGNPFFLCFFIHVFFFSLL